MAYIGNIKGKLSTQIDPFNLADAAEKLPELEAAVDAEEQEIREEGLRLQRRQHELEMRKELVKALRKIAARVSQSEEQGASGEAPNGFFWSILSSYASQIPTRNRILEVIKALDEPVQVDDLMPYLLPDTKRETAQWALWKAEQDGELERVAKGVYALATATTEVEGGDG